jgi:hypothetical protein
MNIIDARGLSCPEPVILTREAIAKNEPNRYRQYKILWYKKRKF